MKRFLFLIAIVFFQFNSYAQFNFYDPDIQSFTVKGDSFFVETELISLVKPLKIKPDDNRVYTWVFGGQIQSNQGGYAGRLLHGEYTSMNNDRSMRVQGFYKFGLKDKVWKHWYGNGNLKSVYTWKNGRQDGYFADYDEDGNALKTGNYKKDSLQGKLFTFQSNAVISVSLYRNGKLIRTQEVKKKESTSASFFKRLFSKKRRTFLESEEKR